MFPIHSVKTNREGHFGYHLNDLGSMNTNNIETWEHVTKKHLFY